MSHFTPNPRISYSLWMRIRHRTQTPNKSRRVWLLVAPRHMGLNDIQTYLTYICIKGIYVDRWRWMIGGCTQFAADTIESRFE